jgi:hypothetical protein
MAITAKRSIEIENSLLHQREDQHGKGGPAE